MWTDLAAQLWPTLPLFFLAACCFVLGGFIWLVAIRRHDLSLGPDPVLPPVVHVDHPLADERADADTHVVAYIPGATPAESALTDRRIPPYMLADPPPDDDYVCDEIIIGPKLRQETGPSVEDLDRLAARLCAAPDLGPVCPFCGGPWHAQCPSAPKRADDCPLTTDEIRIPTDETVPLYAATVRGETFDLTEKLKKVTA